MAQLAEPWRCPPCGPEHLIERELSQTLPEDHILVLLHTEHFPNNKCMMYAMGSHKEVLHLH